MSNRSGGIFDGWRKDVVPVVLKLQKTTDADPARGWASTEFYEILIADEVVGTIQLRLGNTVAMRMYGGHVGYNIEPKHRGNGYACAALRQLAAIAERHGFSELWITCRPDNVASQRTLEKAGAYYVETIAVPPTSDLHARGDFEMQRYRLIIAAHQDCRVWQAY